MSVDAAEVRAICAKHRMPISAIEALLSGGTRVVLQNGDDAALLRRTLKAKLIDGVVRRAAWAAHQG